jgi:hypothetical protein
VYDQLKTLGDEKKQLVSELKEARSQLDQKYREREQVTDDFHDSLGKYEYNQPQIAEARLHL